MSNNIDFNVCAVLPAGGNGLRMGISRPKQYCTIFGRPLLSYTLETFEKIPWIKTVFVTVSPDWKQYVLDMISKNGHNKTIVAIGSDTRHRSIYEGIKHIEGSVNDPDVVIIHDAVRPFVPIEVAKDVVLAAKEFGACGITVPLISTVIAVDQNGFLDHSLERFKYKNSEMPQAFQYKIIKGAYDKCTDYDFEYGTECLHIAQQYTGCKVKLIDCSNFENLWKVTKLKDLYSTEGILCKNYHHTVLYNDFINPDAASFMANLCEYLKSNGIFEKVEHFDSHVCLPKSMTEFILWSKFGDRLLENVIDCISSKIIIIVLNEDKISNTKSELENKIQSLTKSKHKVGIYGIVLSDAKSTYNNLKLCQLCQHLLWHSVPAFDRHVFIL